MLVARSQFALVFKSLNQTDYELFAIGGVDHLDLAGADVIAIEKYSSKTQSWQIVDVGLERINEGEYSQEWLLEYLGGLRGHQAALLPDGSIYIIGGCIQAPTSYDDGTQDGDHAPTLLYQSTVLKFDTESNKLSCDELPPMNQPRGFFGAVLSQNLRYIYVIGGLTSSSSTSVPVS